MGSRSCCSGWVGLLCLTVLLALSEVPHASGQLQCPVPQLTVFPNGSVNFDQLPPGREFVQPVVDTGAASGWYTLAAGFVDVVRPGSLPYDRIRMTLSDAGVPCNLFETNCPADGSQGSEFDVQTTLTSFATWWVGLIIVTLIGGIGAIAFCITGLCFCCCRCCGNCGGSKTQSIQDNMDCKAFTFAIILLFLLALLFAGVVLAFFSNQQTFDSVSDANTTINNVVTDGINYIDDTIMELEQIVCQLAGGEGAAVVVVNEARQFSGTLQSYINDLEGEVEVIYQSINTLSPSYNGTIDILTNLSSTTTGLVASGNTLNTSLNTISTSLTAVIASCANLGGMCGTLPDPAIFQAGANFNQVPNVDSQLNDVSNAINNVNFGELVDEGQRTFNEIRSGINESVNANVDEALNQVIGYNDTLFGFVNNVTSTVRQYIDDSEQQCDGSFFNQFGNLQLNVGFFRQCIINAAFSEIERYDVYRYAFGVIICSLALVTIVLGLLGILLGMCGFRKNRDPDQRTKLSHCGGICLILDVIVTFFFGFVLLILCCVFFFFGANAQKLCQSIEGPEYPLFTELVDNATFWGGSIPARFFPNSTDNPNPQLAISGVLNNCEQNFGIYEAANLSLLVPSGGISSLISSIVNLDEIRQSINGAISNATQDFDFNQTSFLPDSVQNSLEEFRNSSVDQINITAFREEINAPLVLFNITEQIEILMAINDMLTTVPAQDAIDARNMVNTAINELNDIQTNQIPSIRRQVDQLEGEVNGLDQQINTVIANTTALVDTINSVIQNITGQSLPQFLDENVNVALDRIFLLLNESIDYVDVQLSTNVGGCQPLWGIYTQLYNSVCEEFLQGLNGFWWSLGFCALLFIPIIVFLVLTSNYYLKKASDVVETAGYSSYEDYPMKNY